MRCAAAVLLLAVLGALARAQAPDPESDPMIVQRRMALILRQASQYYEAGEYKAALEHLGKLGGPAAQDLSVLNLRGAILTKLGDYNQALQLFQSILEADPNYFPAAFNLGEVQFVRGDYAGALASFREMARRDPLNELVRFKIMLCELLVGNDDEARRVASGLVPAGATPAWYYAQAMLALKQGDRRGMEKHTAVARDIYGADACRLFDESVAVVKF